MFISHLKVLVGAGGMETRRDSGLHPVIKVSEVQPIGSRWRRTLPSLTTTAGYSSLPLTTTRLTKHNDLNRTNAHICAFCLFNETFVDQVISGLQPTPSRLLPASCPVSVERSTSHHDAHISNNSFLAQPSESHIPRKTFGTYFALSDYHTVAS